MSATKGNWSIAGLSGVVGIHAALLHTSQVLFYARPEEPRHNPALNNGLPENVPDATLSTIIDLEGPRPFTPHIVQVQENPFCSGLTFLADGRLFVAGGDKKYYSKFPIVPKATTGDGRFSLRTFTAAGTQSDGHGLWQETGRMADARWYPTCVLLSDGRVLIISGYLDDMTGANNQNPTCELYPPSESGPQYLPFLVDAWPHDAYPFAYALPNGSVFVFIKDRAYSLTLEKDKPGREQWKVRAGTRLPLTSEQTEEPAKQYPNSATAVLLPLLPENAYAAEVLLIGGGGINVHTHWTKVHTTQQNTYEVDARATCFRMQVCPPSANAWQPTTMAHKRVMPDSVLLPDGTVLVVNGTSRGFAGGDPATGPMRVDYAVREAELYDPVTDTWTSLAASPIPRLYHSTALLLPDATVLVAGSDHQDPDKSRAFEYRVEVFEPPYLFSGTQKAERPIIRAVQENVPYKQLFEVEVENLPQMAESDLRVALLRPGAVTHGNNMSQRHIGLRVLGRSSTHLQLEAPPTGDIAPPGHYMLFLLHKGIPSVARFIKLEQNAPTEPENVLPVTAELRLWLRADSGVGTDEHGAVGSWSDSSGQGNDMSLKSNIGADAVQCPPRLVRHAVNGHPVVRFSLLYNPEATPIPYGACLESTNSAFLPGGSPYSVFIVAHPWPPAVVIPESSQSAGWGDLVGWGDYRNDNTFVGVRLGPYRPLHRESLLPKVPGRASIISYWSHEWQFGYQGLQDNASKYDPEKDPLVSLSSPVLIETFFDGEATGIRINGDHEHIRSHAPGGGRRTGDGPITLGLNSGIANKVLGPDGFSGVGAYYRGDMAEVIIYERYIQGPERYEIQEYLRRKYALW